MKKILVVSDTHGEYRNVVNLIQNMAGLDYMIHLGDHAEDADYISDITGIKVLSVRGNNDHYSLGVVPERLIFNEGKFRILAVHGHRQAVGFNLTRLSELAMDEDADIVLYGHTHFYSEENHAGIKFLNPGSPSIPRDYDRTKTVAILNLGQYIEIEKVIL